jgi:hypothetical protein
MKKIGQKAKKRFDKGFERFIDGLGRKIFVYAQNNRAECPNCYYDKANDKSSGICKVDASDPNYFLVGRCPVCLGKGVLTTSIRKCINGVVIWDPRSAAMNALTYNEAGKTGATKIQIKTDVCNLELLRDCKYVVIDGINCKLANPPLLRGIGTKSIVVANFFTEKKPSSRSGEFV